MDPERWRRLKELVLAALEREPDEREAWLRRAASDDELAGEALRLIEHDGAGAWVELGEDARHRWLLEP